MQKILDSNKLTTIQFRLKNAFEHHLLNTSRLMIIDDNIGTTDPKPGIIYSREHGLKSLEYMLFRMKWRISNSTISEINKYVSDQTGTVNENNNIPIINRPIYSTPADNLKMSELSTLKD